MIGEGSWPSSLTRMEAFRFQVKNDFNWIRKKATGEVGVKRDHFYRKGYFKKEDISTKLNTIE